MAKGIAALPQFIPSPPINAFHIGPLEIHFYALGYIIGITLAILITRRRWRALGGDPDLVNDIALWVVPAGIIGGRIYFDITTPGDIPHVWYGVFAVWTGGLGIWGGVALAAAVGAWRLHKLGITVGPFANAIAPALLVAQAVGRLGNYFNKELFGKPTTLPWGLEIPYAYRLAGGIPAQDLHYATFQPSFLYELIWDLALAAFLVWLGHHAKIKPWGLFALYVAGYSAYRIFEETIRIDSSEYFLGLRLNMFVAIALTVVGMVWFILAQRRPERPYTVLPASAAGAVEDTRPGDAAAVMNDPEAADSEAADPEAADSETADPEAADPEAADPEAAAPEAAEPGQASATDEAKADEATVSTARSDELSLLIPCAYPAAIAATFAPAALIRSAGAISISSPRRPALQNSVPSSSAEESMMTGSRFRCPSGEMPPAT
jgi:prolipoprotein diacylglyceryl transferase